MGITFSFVTHDQEEALTMSDTIVVLNDGLIQQIGTPVDIYNEPRNRFVANFAIGESDVTNATMIEDYKVEFEGHIFECVDRGYHNPNETVEVVDPSRRFTNLFRKKTEPLLESLLIVLFLKAFTMKLQL